MNKLVVANLKMNLNYEEAKKYKETLKSYIDNLVICPPYIYLDVMNSDNYILGSQDGYYVDKGAYTGEISFAQLKTIGVKYSIIGHSERRHKFGETDEIVKNKLNACINNGIMPILCVGETEEERELNKTFEVIETQLKVLEGMNIKNIIIAYEPVWAIGSGKTPTEDEIHEVHKYIRELLTNVYNMESIIMYGGSVNLSNIKSISNIDGVDGMLIGSASIDPNNLLNMIKEIEM